MSGDTDRARYARWWIPAVLGAYVVSYLAYLPSAILVVDEEAYVAQALAFASGARTLPGAGRSYEGMPFEVMSNYPLGTSLLQAPFVALGGWPLASLASVLALLAATVITARWLRDLGRDPRFALVIPGFLPAALFGRIGMSDVPSAMLVALALWLLWRAEQGSAAPRGDGRRAAIVSAFFAAFVAGASVLFRELNLLLLAPFFVGALVRRRVSLPALVVGALAGLGLRLALSAWIFGDALYVRDAGFPFTVGNLTFTALPWAVTLIVLLPGALILPALYRGPWRTECSAAVLLYVGTHLLYGYDAVAQNGLGKGILLMARYAIPLVPIFTVMAAEVLSTRTARLSPSRRVSALRLVTAAAACALLVGVGVHPLAAAQERVVREVRTTLYDETTPEVPVVINEMVMLKYASPVYGPRQLVFRRDLDTRSVEEIGAAYPVFTLALLDRTDSELFAVDAQRNAEFVERLRTDFRLELEHDSTPTAWSRLRIYAVRVR